VNNASYSWTGPNGFTSHCKNPVINNATAANAGSYIATVTVGQCTSASANTTGSCQSHSATPGCISIHLFARNKFEFNASLIPAHLIAGPVRNNFSSTNQNPTILMQDQ
jgi:hypothetical protein